MWLECLCSHTAISVSSGFEGHFDQGLQQSDSLKVCFHSVSPASDFSARRPQVLADRSAMALMPLAPLVYYSILWYMMMYCSRLWYIGPKPQAKALTHSGTSLSAPSALESTCGLDHDGFRDLSRNRKQPLCNIEIR